MTGNKGEWSEFYTFLKLLADKKIYGADTELNKVEELFFPIISIIRNESSEKHEYIISESDDVIEIAISDTDTITIHIENLKEKTKRIFESIQSGSNTFTIPLASELMEKLHVSSIKAGRSNKEDLALKIHDLNTNTQQTSGFSIKSMVGSPATLLNSSTATNFKYKIKNCTDEILQTVNQIDTKGKIRDRINSLKKSGCEIVFDTIESDTFLANLRMSDTVLPQILSEYLLFYFSSNGSSLSNLTSDVLTNGTVCEQYNINETSLVHKIKSFLHAVALGMVPASSWSGEMSANGGHGGYIIVREDGELVCYHVFNADQFREYLYQNVKFDSPSASRHGYGVVYQQDGSFYINLNIQIRFLK